MYSDLVTRFNHVCLKWCPTKTQFVFLCLASVNFFPDLESKLLDIKNYSVKVSIEYMIVQDSYGRRLFTDCLFLSLFHLFRQLVKTFEWELSTLWMNKLLYNTLQIYNIK